ncbi:hypothetical protein TNCV_1306391 [Trichonephila clavipes]|nr:hypothetical protein TNCV_1306391 [Trichonephila clavipes]
MWLSDEETNFEDDCIKEQGNEKMRFRSNSPPFEGGESLCEFILDPPEQSEKLRSFQFARPLSENHDGSPNINIQNDVFHYVGEGKLPCRNFLSLLNQDLLPTSTFTQTFLQSILSSVDSTDPVVANAWMETLLDVIDLLPKEIVKGEILTLAVNKGQMSQPVSSRLLCCKMLGKICLKFDAYVIKKEVLPVVLSLCQDVDFEVRGYMCRQLDIVAKGIGLEATKSAILPELVELANDEETFVRLAAIETVVQMLPLLDDDTCTQAIIPLVKKLCENSFSSKDSTLPVVSKQLGQLCCGLANIFSVEQKQWFLKFFQELSKLGLPNTTKNRSPFCSPLPDLLPEVDHKDRFRECRHACAYNFPAMVLFIGSENFEKELYATFKDLCSDPFLSVRQTVACGFYEIVRLLDSKASLLQQELVTLLQDDCLEVLKGIIPYLPECLKIICCCTQDSDKSSLVKALIACEEATSVTSSWRLHADFLSCLSCLPSCISSEIIFTTFVPLLFVKLHTAAIFPSDCLLSLADRAPVHVTKPVIDYGSELLVTASDSALSKLDIVQNKALRFITGAATLTPIAAMQLQTEISGPSERRQYSAFALGEQLLRKELPIFKPTTFLGHLRYASAKLDLVLPICKHNSLLAESRSSALAISHERYPDQDWVYVFTDGSATASFGRAGTGDFSSSFNLKEPLSAWSDNFVSEIFAKFMAFRAISATPGQNIVIFIDSQAAIIKTVSGCNVSPSKLEFKCKQLINSFLNTRREVVLQWIPFHCGIHENEQANKLVKEGSSCIHLAFRCLFETPSNFSGTNFDKISAVTELAVGKSWSLQLDGQRHVQLSALPRVEGVECLSHHWT